MGNSYGRDRVIFMAKKPETKKLHLFFLRGHNAFVELPVTNNLIHLDWSRVFDRYLQEEKQKAIMEAKRGRFDRDSMVAGMVLAFTGLLAFVVWMLIL